jgi:deferrochelatase/peroxidase EfeB
MDPVLAVQAAILVGNWIANLVAMHQAGVISNDQFTTMWTALGLKVQTDDAAVAAAEAASRARQMAHVAQPVPPVVDTSLATTPR